MIVQAPEEENPILWLSWYSYFCTLVLLPSLLRIYRKPLTMRSGGVLTAVGHILRQTQRRGCSFARLAGPHAAVWSPALPFIRC